jgi:hypothetical protein
LIIGLSRQNIGGVIRFVTAISKPLCQRWRQVRINKKAQPAAQAMTTG